MSCILEIPQAVTVRSIADFALSLCEAVDAHSEVALEAGALGEVDLSFVQLVLAARAHAARKGGAVRLTGPASPALAALLERAGFLAEADPADLEFWFQGELPQ